MNMRIHFLTQCMQLHPTNIKETLTLSTKYDTLHNLALSVFLGGKALRSIELERVIVSMKHCMRPGGK